MSVGFVLIFSTFLAYLLTTFSLRHLSASSVSYYIYLQPFFATLISLFISGESVNMIQILACVLIFTWVYLVNARPLVKMES